MKTKLESLRQMAEQGDAEAQYKLGDMYLSGNGVSQDSSTAYYWYGKACEQGNEDAWTSLLGEFWEETDQQLQDELLEWFCKMAVHGDARAQSILGMIYEDGLVGSEKEDKVLAYVWYELASSQGDEDARKSKDGLSLTPAELDEAKRLSSSWKPGQKIEREKRCSEPSRTPSGHSSKVRHKRYPKWGEGTVVNEGWEFLEIDFPTVGRRKFKLDCPDLIFSKVTKGNLNIGSPDCDWEAVEESLRSFLKSQRSHKPLQVSQRPKLRKSGEGEAYFDLLAFDLDGTLTDTNSLEHYRGRENVGKDTPQYHKALIAALSGQHHIIAQDEILNLRSEYGSLKLAVCTRAPRRYATTVLSHFYPKIKWDAVICYEDVTYTKPSPEGLLKAAESLGGIGPFQVLVLGDGPDDAQAAYQAGASFAFWGNRPKHEDAYRSQHYRALDQIPDAVIDSLKALLFLLRQPEYYLPALELVDALSEYKLKQPNSAWIKRSIRRINCFGPRGASPMYVPVSVLGRYFSKIVHHFDYGPRKDSHRLTAQLLAFKKTHKLPAYSVDLLANIAKDFIDRTPAGRKALITAIPARPGEKPRMEDLLQSMIARGTPRDCIAPNILSFKKGVKSQSKDCTTAAERSCNIRDNLFVSRPQDVRASNILVIDDIVTTGFTLYWTHEALNCSGAEHVELLALAKAIS